MSKENIENITKSDRNFAQIFVKHHLLLDIWVEVNDESRETYNANTDIKLRTSMIRSYSSDYSDAYIHVKETTTVPNTAAAAAPINNTNKKVIFKFCASFTNCISEINNTQLNDAQDIVMVMPMYNLIESSSKTQEVYGNTIEMNQLYTITKILLIFLLKKIIGY